MKVQTKSYIFAILCCASLLTTMVPLVAQNSDTVKHNSEQILETCFSANCENIYSQETLIRTFGVYLDRAFHHNYYSKPSISKINVFGALTILRKLRPCYQDNCLSSIPNWTEKTLAEADELLSCMRSTPTNEYDDIIRNKRMFYYSDSGGIEIRKKILEKDNHTIDALYPWLSGPERNGISTDGVLSYVFFTSDTFPNCGKSEVSYETLLNLRLAAPKRSSTNF